MLPVRSSAPVRAILASLGVLLVSLLLSSWPQDNANARATLNGITAIWVVVEYSNDFNADARPVDLKRDQLQADVKWRPPQGRHPGGFLPRTEWTVPPLSQLENAESHRKPRRGPTPIISASNSPSRFSWRATRMLAFWPPPGASVTMALWRPEG